MSTFPEWQHKFTATRPYPSYGPQHTIKVEAGLHHLSGDTLPYFSVGGGIGRLGARDCDACGCIHDLILPFWPELAPIVALHLSDSDGVPMHAEANGWYQLAGYYGGAGERYHAGNSQRHTIRGYDHPNPEECLQSFAEYVRIPLKEARILADGWQRGIPVNEVRPLYQVWIEQQRPRWKTEAVAAAAILKLYQAGRL